MSKFNVNKTGQRPNRSSPSIRRAQIFVFAVAFIVIGFIASAMIDFEPTRLIKKLLNWEQTTEVSSSQPLINAFDSFKLAPCEGELDFALLIENKSDLQGNTVLSEIPAVGSLLEWAADKTNDALFLDSAAMQVDGNYQIVAPFELGKGFNYQIDEVNNTATIYISRFILTDVNTNPFIVKRAGGIVTLASLEDPLFEQATKLADLELTNKVVSGEAIWFDRCAEFLDLQWRALGAVFDYDVTVVVDGPSYPIRVALDYGKDPQQLAEVILEISSRNDLDG